MEEYSNQITEAIDNTLQELSAYIFHITNLKNGIKSLNSSDYQYYNDDLINSLSRFSDDIVIPKLQAYINILKSVSKNDIVKVFPDTRDWEDELISEEETRNAIFQNIKDTLELIQNIVGTKKIINRPPLGFFQYEGNKENLIEFKKILEKERLISPISTNVFVDIFQGGRPDERINWTISKSYFRYFLRELFNKVKHRTIDWKIVNNTFTFQNEPIPNSMKSNNGGMADKQIIKIINSAVDLLTDE